MNPIDYYILIAGIAAIVFLSTALGWLVNKVEALTWRVATTEDLLEQLVAQRVHEVTTQSCRSLNEVVRS